MQQLVGNQYQALYKGKNLRHRLFHGSGIEQASASTVFSDAHQAILNYLGSKLGLETVPLTNTPPQRFTRNRMGDYFLKPITPGRPDLKLAEQHWNDEKMYNIIEPEPPGY